MKDIDEVYSALQVGKQAAESLLTWQTRSAGYREAQTKIEEIERGIKACNRIYRDLKDGRKHIAPPDRVEAPTACYCNATSHPPCSFCTP